MSEEKEEIELKKSAQDIFKQTGKLLEDIKVLIKSTNIQGLSKFYKKVEREYDFFQSILTSNTKIHKSHVNCANFFRFIAIYDTVITQQDVVEVLALVPISNKKSLEIDVVCRSGLWWIKVKSMHADAIQMIVDGKGSEKDKSVIETAEEMLYASSKTFKHLVHPNCIIRFYNGVTDEVSNELKEMGVIVQDIPKFNIVDKDEYSIPNQEIINLDVTTLIVLVSDLTNGGSDAHFTESVLEEQANDERKTPILPILNKIMKGKVVVATKSACDIFNGIIENVGGEKEAERAKELLKNIKIIDDCPSQRFQDLKENNRFQKKHKDIFGTSDTLKALTLTANHHIIAYLENQKININYYQHGARALTERKRLKQKPSIISLKEEKKE